MEGGVGPSSRLPRVQRLNARVQCLCMMHLVGVVVSERGPGEFWGRIRRAPQGLRWRATLAFTGWSLCCSSGETH